MSIGTTAPGSGRGPAQGAYRSPAGAYRASPSSLHRSTRASPITTTSSSWRSPAGYRPVPDHRESQQGTPRALRIYASPLVGSVDRGDTSGRRKTFLGGSGGEDQA